MQNRLSDELIEDIRSSSDIADVVGEYIQLKKQGRNFFGLCPFHGESTPSFSVSPDKQIFHCFGCGKGGNVYSFLMDIEGITFIEAVKILADKSQIALPDITTSESSRSDFSVMIDAHELLKKLYHHLLLHTKEGKKALDYLYGRGFNDEMIKTFELGFAPLSNDFVVKFLTKRGFNLQQMLEAGLIAKNEKYNQYVDRFRDRVMFPIADLKGNSIAFGGRIMEEGNPKYLNSPETPIFDKGKTLYGLHLARPMIRKKQEVILFEGYIDVISAYSAGVKNGVATLGTSLTEDHAKLIRRNVETVVICYDSDNAGLKAAVRTAKILSAAACNVKIAELPEGFDPDDYIKKYGSEKFMKNVIGATKTVAAFKIQYLRKGKNLSNEGDRIRYIEEVLEEISDLSKAVERDHYLRQIADEFSISLEALKSQQFQIYKQRQSQSNHTKQTTNYQKMPSLKIEKKLLPAYHNAERILIAHMLRNRELADRIQDLIGIEFNIEEHQAIVTYLYAFYEEGNRPSISSFMHRLQDHKLQQLVSNIAMMSVNEEVMENELTDYIKQVLNYPKWLMIKDKEKEKKEAEHKQDFVKAAQIGMEIIKMKKALKSS